MSCYTNCDRCGGRHLDHGGGRFDLYPKCSEHASDRRAQEPKGEICVEQVADAFGVSRMAASELLKRAMLGANRRDAA